MAIRTALVGFGLSGSVFHAPFLAADPDYEVVAVVTTDPAKASVVREVLPTALPVPSVAKAIEQNIDVAIVATPNQTHVRITRELLDRGVAVVVDKPLAVTAAEAWSLIQHAEAAGVLLTCYQNRRWDGDFLTLRRLVDAGELGTIIRLESRYERWQQSVGTSWQEAAEPGSGVLYALGPHVIDQALTLNGPATLTHAEFFARRTGSALPDDVFLCLDHASGAVSHLSMTLTAGSPGPRFRVLGTRAGWISRALDSQEAALRAGSSPASPHWGQNVDGELHRGSDTTPVPTVSGDYAAFYRGLSRAIIAGAAPPVDPADSARVLEIVDAAITLASRGGTTAGS